MPRKNRPAQPAEKNQPAYIVNQIKQISVDRTPKDVLDLRQAHKWAESVQHPNRSRLYDLFSDVEIDGHLTGIIGKRISAVSNKTLRFVKNDQEVEEMKTFCESTELTNIIKGILESLFWGITGLEFIPGEKVTFKEIPRKHIKPEKGIITISQSDQEGIPYADLKNVMVVGDEKDLGLYLKCSFYALIKKGTFADWAQYVEIFGQPMRIVKYDSFDTTTQTQLKAVLDESGSSLTLMIPKQADFEIADGKTSNGDGQLQERLKNACNNEMSIIILGNTETTSSDNGGSNAKAQEQGKQQLEVTKDDLKMVVNILNSPKFMAILKEYNLPIDGGSFKLEKEINLTELTARKDIDIAIAKVVPVGDNYFYETYNIPKPDNYNELKAKMEAAAQAHQPGNDGPPKPGKGKPPAGKTPKKEVKLSAWEKVRETIANFFDQAPSN